MRQTPRHTCVTRHESNRLQGQKSLLGENILTLRWISRHTESLFMFGILASNIRAAFLEVCTIVPCSPCRFSILQTHMEYQRGLFPLKTFPVRNRIFGPRVIWIYRQGTFGFALSAVSCHSERTWCDAIQHSAQIVSSNDHWSLVVKVSVLLGSCEGVER